MEPILTETIRFRIARVIAQRNSYLQQRGNAQTRCRL